MANTHIFDYRAPLAIYEQLANTLFADLKSNNPDAAWRFKWEHPAFRGQLVTDVLSAAHRLTLEDAWVVIARDHAFEDWQSLRGFVKCVQQDGPVREFEDAVEAVVGGDAARLQDMLLKNPTLTKARSVRRHRATLLHYIAANGVESYRQKTPANALLVTEMLLQAGAEVDALADMYDEKATTMNMLVSSCHPAEAGLQQALAEKLLDYGAVLDKPITRWQSPVLTALIFGYGETAAALARRSPPTQDIAIAAGLGQDEDVARLLPAADAESRQAALALAAQHGRTQALRILLDAGEDPNRFNLEGFHAHSTPLHQAVWANQLAAVRLLVEWGAAKDIRDRLHQSTPLGWAVYGNRSEIAAYLRSQGALE